MDTFYTTPPLWVRGYFGCLSDLSMSLGMPLVYNPWIVTFSVLIVHGNWLEGSMDVQYDYVDSTMIDNIFCSGDSFYFGGFWLL